MSVSRTKVQTPIASDSRASSARVFSPIKNSLQETETPTPSDQVTERGVSEEDVALLAAFFELLARWEENGT